MNQNLKQGGIRIRTRSRSRLLVEARACFLSVFFLLSAFCVLADSVPVGSIIAWSTVYAPENWLLCDGAAYPVTVYTSLYAVISTTYGAVTNEQGACFKVPDLRQRFPLGWNPSIQRPIASIGGAETVILSSNQLPAHKHSVRVMESLASSGHSLYADWGSAGGDPYIAGYWANAGGEAGGGLAHNNMSPYLVVNYIIKAVPDEQQSFFGDLEEIELWNLKVGLWIFGGICAFILSVCFFLRR